MIRIDKQKALEIHKEKIRERRKDIFPTLDVDFMKALERGDTQLAAEIGAKKQTLRDLTNIETGSIETLSDIKNLWNTDILGESPYS